MKWRPLCAVGAVVLIAGCGVDPADLPVPGARVSGASYEIRIEFASVLSLPAKAKVMADGAEVGVVDRVELADRVAIATVDLTSTVQLPKSTTAEIRQTTLLGESYIALRPPAAGAGPRLTSGDVIPLAQTRPPDSVENLLRGMSNVLANGRFDDLATAIGRVNAAFPDDGEYQRLAAEIRADVHDLSTGTADLDRVLDSAAAISDDLAVKRSAVDRALVLGPDRAAGLSDVLFGIVDLSVALGHLLQPAGDLVWPIYGDTLDIYRAMRPLLLTVADADTTIPMNADKFTRLLRDTLIPYFSAPPNIRIHGVATSASAEQQADALVTVLRSIGMVP
ncbi:MlaD family protein [Nocardia sp. NBC_00881]|uniref:MlaD family protein n=1 Tax=Nocardia sp. NBC_00881 TaxID=2975995 RepID=UPI003867B8DA|nr:MlaD family protein [Nocardia sp. NBC_00881]